LLKHGSDDSHEFHTSWFSTPPHLMIFQTSTPHDLPLLHTTWSSTPPHLMIFHTSTPHDLPHPHSLWSFKPPHIRPHPHTSWYSTPPHLMIFHTSTPHDLPHLHTSWSSLRNLTFVPSLLQSTHYSPIYVLRSLHLTHLTTKCLHAITQSLFCLCFTCLIFRASQHNICHILRTVPRRISDTHSGTSYNYYFVSSNYNACYWNKLFIFVGKQLQLQHGHK